MKHTISNLRQEYKRASFDIKDAMKSPFEQFHHWFDDAVKSEILEPNAFTLATVDAEGMPDARILLLKGLDKTGFVFYTNYESTKGTQIAKNPKASMVFFWPEVERQVRLRGVIEKVSQNESREYFHSRPRASQLGAWSSKQSSNITNRSVITDQFTQYEKEFGDDEIPLPDFWGGYRLLPSWWEFWQGRESRLHDRIAYTQCKTGWQCDRLSP
jgi:pyridoxamine 5'-phosphate oxidase